jgi:hypothetical protein
MVDAQFTNVRVLKPFEGFERVYQGQSLGRPIAFPGARDPRAQQQKPGFDPNLMSGTPVPEGARVILWFPMCLNPVTMLDNPIQFYSYRLIWRYRNLGDYRDPPARKRRAPYHFPRQSPGAPETLLGVPLPRVTLPASWHVIAYEQTEPSLGAGELVVRSEKITPKIDSLLDYVQPLLPDGSEGVIQQGVIDPATLGAADAAARMPIFVPFWTDAEGDELIILANRETVSAAPNDVWDFTAPADTATPPTGLGGDLAFSNIYGTGNGTHPIFRDLGIYLQTGTAP